MMTNLEKTQQAIANLKDILAVMGSLEKYLLEYEKLRQSLNQKTMEEFSEMCLSSNLDSAADWLNKQKIDNLVKAKKQVGANRETQMLIDGDYTEMFTECFDNIVSLIEDLEDFNR